MEMVFAFVSEGCISLGIDVIVVLIAAERLRNEYILVFQQIALRCPIGDSIMM